MSKNLEFLITFNANGLLVTAATFRVNSPLQMLGVHDGMDVFTILVLVRQRQMESWGSLPRHPSLVSDPRVSVRKTVLKTKTDSSK